MSVSADALRTHIDYTAWASQKLVATASLLSPEELSRDFQTSERCVLNTLVHVFAADRSWLSRLTEGKPHPGFVSSADYLLAVLQNQWPILHERWKRWALDLTDEKAAAPLDYVDWNGVSHSQPVWQIVLHVVNHGTHHRGQVSGFLRALGHAPPPLDLLFYYWERG